MAKDDELRNRRFSGEDRQPASAWLFLALVVVCHTVSVFSERLIWHGLAKSRRHCGEHERSSIGDEKRDADDGLLDSHAGVDEGMGGRIVADPRAGTCPVRLGRGQLSCRNEYDQTSGTVTRAAPTSLFPP